MADPVFRADQHARLRDHHIRPITDLVTELSKSPNGYIPYVAPSYGGIEAQVLFLFQDPGPKTQTDGGSGMLCAENDDPTAEVFSSCLDEAGLDVGRVVTWNAYPWYINTSPTAKQLDAGVAPLLRLLELLTEAKVVMLMGRRAEESWRRLSTRNPVLVQNYFVIASLHPGGRGITRGGQTTRTVGIDKLTSDMRRAVALLGGSQHLD